MPRLQRFGPVLLPGGWTVGVSQAQSPKKLSRRPRIGAAARPAGRHSGPAVYVPILDLFSENTTSVLIAVDKPEHSRLVE